MVGRDRADLTGRRRHSGDAHAQAAVGSFGTGSTRFNESGEADATVAVDSAAALNHACG
jgi:hypothetical protein